MTVCSATDTSTRLSARERVEVILSQLDRLPTLPAVAARLLALTTSKESSAGDVAEAIESDASLTSAILRMVRRADLGVHDQAMTVARAVSLLGFSAVRNAVLSVQIYETLPTPDHNDRAGRVRRELWKHNLAVACAADMLAERIGHGLGDGAAFVCGLLHDIGRIALDVCLPKSYARVMERVERERGCFTDIEREVLGLDHTTAGKRLATRWQLPLPIVECVWLHHQSADALPSTVTNQDLVKLVHLADALVRRQRLGRSDYTPVDDIEEVAASFSIDEAELDRIVDKLPARMEPFLDLIGLDASSGRALYAESLGQANQELGRLNAELAESNRRLEVRSACSKAIRAFTEKLTEQDQIGDVCIAAAESIRSMVGASCTVALVGSPSNRCLHTGWARGGDEGSGASIVELDEATTRNLLQALVGLDPRRGIAAAPSGSEEVWRRCCKQGTREPLWVLPFAEANSAVGGVLFVAKKRVIGRLESAMQEWGALSTAIGLAVRTASARVDAERMNEELLHLNRRFRAAQQGLLRSRSVSMIAEMAAGAAHELNNPLSVVSGRAQMELERCADPDLARALSIIVERVNDASQIVMELMQYAKPAIPEPLTEQLGDVLESLCQRWRADCSLRDDQVIPSLADPEVTVFADSIQLRTILDAVMRNAVDSCDKESIRLKVNSPSRVSDDTVRIVIEDNGVGMTRDVLEHAVDPFFSSHPAGRGRGLGLSRAYRLAEVNGGSLWLESISNVGTTVTIELPARPPSS